MTTQPMPLEETVKLLREFTDHQESLQQFYTEPLPGIPVLRAAIHHLEAGKRECECKEWKKGGKFLSQAVGFSAILIPDLKLCPWCGGTLKSSTEEPQG